MTTMPGYRPHVTTPPQRRGMGTASVVLGVVAVPLALLVGLGAVPAAIGLGVGIAGVTRQRDRGRAVVGIVVCALALLLALGVLSWFLSRAAECGDVARYPDRTARRLCIEREFPFARTNQSPQSSRARTASPVSAVAYIRRSSKRPANPSPVGSRPR
ncbi:MAG: hypothetical protein QOE54_3438 [Streptosporangiaceae bacterium]|jgi:hypothetical protein|nr:hypothetical protein [Streptosporangiaceae bacterium]MDX6431072.1 hypothetical protein [Streptosporangiaceae bacterium]